MNMRKILIIVLCCLTASLMWAQDEPATDPTPTPAPQTIVNIRGKVFGGARQADIGGTATVNIGAKKHDVIIDAVYGGNDISGTIGKNTEDYDARVNTTDDGKHLFIGQLFGGGYGDYTYDNKKTDTDGNITYDVTYKGKEWDAKAEEFKEVDHKLEGITKPEVDSVSVNIQGGIVAYLYGGGDNVTVKKRTNISINNQSAFASSTDFPADVMNQDRLEEMGLLDMTDNIDDYDYHFSRVFGGNNKAEMAIMPTWDLQKGSIENLYSGGNAGDMTSPIGILLEVNPSPEGTDEEKQKLVIYNVYGGCRKADVHPMDENGNDVTVTNAAFNEFFGYVTPATYKYKFPDEFAARLLLRGGKITNVYGGNDITGRVYGGNAVGVYTSVEGDVYGGGNGSYPYTDKKDYKDNIKYKDYYYTIPTGKSSVQALNDFRPNAEQVTLRVAGYPVTNAAGDTIDIKPTIIHGGVFVGGNSATLKKKEDGSTPKAELKIGSYVLADNVFLGNNGANMVTNNDEERDADDKVIKEKGILQVMKEINTMDLTDAAIFAEYMNGCAMDMMPSVSFDKKEDGDPATYEDYSTFIGSIFCGGNVGSMTKSGLTTMEFNRKLVVFDKVVGGCNNAYVAAKSGVNAEYNGGIIGATDERTTYLDGDYIKNRLVMNFNGLKLQPKRWRITEGTYTDPAVTDDDKLPINFPNKYLIWNTVDGSGNPTAPVTALTPDAGKTTESSTEADLKRRFVEGHIYGGCYSSGVINGNVVINLNNSIIDRDLLFDEVLEDTLGEAILYGHEGYTIKTRRTGVILDEQGMDVLGAALNVFGGGKGAGTEIWGSTTINLNAGYTFQIFGGSEEGVIGRASSDGNYDFSYTLDDGTTINKKYKYDPRYSCYVNLAGANAGVSKRKDSSEAMAECEFMYGGGFFGPICGNTVINLGKGRIFNSFAGSCNADILGHTETYIGRQVKEGDATSLAEKYKYKNNFGKYIAAESTYEPGFPWVRDIVYGGNDLGGRIMEKTPANFKNRLRQTSSSDTLNVFRKVYNPQKSAIPSVLQASAYVEYLQGRVDGIFGGCYGTYDYTNRKFEKYTYYEGESGIPAGKAAGDARVGSGFTKPRMDNAFVNIRPTYTNTNNALKKVYGAGQGMSGDADRDLMQNRSYVLVDIPDSYEEKYKDMEVFGAGAWGGVGMGVSEEDVAADSTNASAVIDLIRGRIAAAYGASYKEGFTRRTVVNVPAYSTIQIDKIFGGGYGIDDAGYQNAKPCDAYEAQVNYRSDRAVVTNAIYGGNNNYRRTLYGQVNIYKPVYNGKKDQNNRPMTATIYGAGCGVGTWSQYTEVNLFNGAEVYEVYGGGEKGKVINKKSVDAWKTKAAATTTPEAERFTMDLSMGSLTDNGLTHVQNTNRDGSKHNTNVHIHKGAIVNMYYVLKDNGTSGYVGGYAYGGGLGDSDDGTGDVYGTTYIDLLGGTVKKDLYAAGTSGTVKDEYDISTDEEPFIASANAYIEGGIARNVYGGGWAGAVGRHQGDITAAWSGDILGETHVIIGKEDGTDFYNGIPAIERNAYGGGEGGPVFGTAHITLNNGYIGYVYNNDGTDDPDTDIDERYEEKINDETSDKEGTLFDSGCIFGGGYIDNSSVDITDVKMYGGYIRNSLFGGGEIAAIGRGTADETEDESGVANKTRRLTGIYKAGETNVYLYDGHVLRHVFGGGRGYDNLGGVGHLYSDGYVFGKTDVNIYGGEVGTDEGMANGYGNVFGGGDVGYVYGALMDPKDGLIVGIKDGERYDDKWEGYYYKYKKGTDPYTPGTKPTDGDSNWVKEDGEFVLTEDCKVLVEPWCRAKEDVSINGHSYSAGDYVPTEVLHYLHDKNSDAGKWSKLDDKGIIIHNAVFAGGNVTSGSDQLYAEAKTVLGNATASIHDVYHRDLITIGTGHTGGLYGDGNLTFVDGYRGLNITNYGTDYYNISMEIGIDAYRKLPAREQAYYELRYSCQIECTDNEGKTYYPANDERKASTITADELMVLFEGTEMILDGKPNPDYWKEEGVCSRYAGRIMNTIQRADFCGVFGSRMVMQGARDRVVDQNDKTNYTINRVREVSLNKQHSVIAGDKALKPGGTEENEDWVEMNKAVHGNYFGIYNIVNYLGALTSDVHFKDPDNGDADIRKTESAESQHAVDGKTYYQWKAAHIKDRTRNNGSSLNKLALASGVYLELTTEKSTGKNVDDKDWGYITGVVELDLINVQAGVGGGFVYAKNVHGKQTYQEHKHSTLTFLNSDAVTRKDFTYSTDDLKEWETSGNFVHSTQTIIDDCYPESNRYSGDNAVPAHYWYIKGQVYVYDQYISAYTGAPSAYSKVEYLNLTITAASHGSMKLVDVKPNRYAYYSYYKSSGENTKLTEDGKLEIGDKVFKLNDPISYWDYNLLSRAEKNLFVDKTYVTIARCKIGDNIYPAGYVMLPEEYEALKEAAGDPKTIEGYDEPVKAVELWTEDEEGHDVKEKDESFDFVFRESNNMDHDKGYILTYDVTNPKEWTTWYTSASGDASSKITKEAYDALSSEQKDNYNNGPTYKPTAEGIYGQKEYKVSDIIEESTYVIYNGDGTSTNKGLVGDHPDAINALNTVDADGDGVADRKQATFDRAYVVTNNITVGSTHLYKGAALAKSQYTDEQWASISSSVTPGFVCTSTLKLDDNVIIYVSTVLTQKEINDYKSAYADQASDIDNVMKPAYYCTSAGMYGGNWYETNKNYRGLAAWSSLSPEDRAYFTFNYDAFDLLIDKNFSRNELEKYQYDGLNFTTEKQAETNPAGYSIRQPLDYKATYNGSADPDDASQLNPMTYKDKSGTEHTVAVGQELDRETYEILPNEQHHYAAITVNKAEEGLTYFVVKKGFIRGDIPYTVGQVISEEEKNSLGDEVVNITTLTFTDADDGKTFYFCREKYEVDKNGEGKAVTGLSISGVEKTGSYAKGQEVPVGLVISSDSYGGLTNRQLNFTIHGIAPIETSTLYVSRQSDIFDLSKEKIITVIYQYDYEESDESGLHITPVSERHVINIHIDFESGVPEVENISKPDIILPGSQISIRTPNVKPGAFEITGGGWMLFERQEDTESHINGIEYTPTADPLYWYQDGYWLAYYAKTYLGKTFSNAVQVSVANYHDLADVMSDENKTHHMYVDNTDVKRDPKIYIKSQDGLTQLKEFFDLSVLDIPTIDPLTGLITGGTFEGHKPLDEQVKAGANLEFFLQTDINMPSESTWTPIGDNTNCFEGILHGDGHTISGLKPATGKTGSLFGKLCGKVYNLGATGSFTGSGIADSGTGRVENCWVSTTGTTTGSKAVFGGTGTLVNSYYVTGQYSSANTGATAMAAHAFYNGTVTYNLNGFYLNKRYYDHVTDGSTEEYNYLQPEDDGTLPTTLSQAKYPTDYAIYRPQLRVAPGETLPNLGYVENRFYDGDYRYAGGAIPEGTEMRERTVTETIGTGEDAIEVDKTYYTPIWPDDYLFFGQALNYDHMDGIDGRDLRTHQDQPSYIQKSGGRIMTTTEGNRVYRAPAYFQSKEMGVAYFNPHAVFAQTKKGAATVKAYENMTAIDFTGYNDVSKGYEKGSVARGFYPPLLDDDGIYGIYFADLTKNILAYTGTSSAAASQTDAVVSSYLTDENCVENDETYRTIGEVDYYSDDIHGHWVQLTDDGYRAQRDHLLVDKEDFNCPISYTFAAGKRMWYQRTPDRYVTMTKGWETISLPFTVELVTTQDKGEITHFYDKSKTVDANGTKIGHEYWLREYGGGSVSGDKFLATFDSPTESSSYTAGTKTVTNTFLWDHYYSHSNQLDANSDTYQTFYKTKRDYDEYAMLTGDQPYIIGFPGKTFYEFDLSGEWVAPTSGPQHTFSPAPDPVGKQTITFASVPGTTIKVSDDELAKISAKDGYIFMPNYLNKTLDTSYLLNGDGDQFQLSSGSVTNMLVPFRPYFVAASSGSRRAIRSIVFDNRDSSFAIGGDQDPSEEEIGEGDLLFTIRKHEIAVTSSLRRAADVRIVNISGVTIANFTIQPGETIERYIPVAGVYIVRADGGRIQKKLALK